MLARLLLHDRIRDIRRPRVFSPCSPLSIIGLCRERGAVSYMRNYATDVVLPHLMYILIVLFMVASGSMYHTAVVVSLVYNNRLARLFVVQMTGYSVVCCCSQHTRPLECSREKKTKRLSDEEMCRERGTS